MKKLELTDNELEILYDILCWIIQDEEDDNSLSRDEFYIQELWQLWQKIKDVQQDKSSDDNSEPQYCVNGGKLETLTDEELKELGGLLNVGISDYLDTSFVIGSEDGKQHAIKQANIYKSIYNKLIKPIYKVDE